MAGGPYRFASKTRRDLRALVKGDDTLVAELESAAGDYVRRQEARDSRGLARRKRDVRRVKAAVQQLQRVIASTDDGIRRRLESLAAPVLETMVRSCAVKGYRPADTRRRQLEHAIGWVLHRHKFRLTDSDTGTLATAIRLVRLDVDGVRVYSLRETCRRVRKDVENERREEQQVAALFPHANDVG